MNLLLIAPPWQLFNRPSIQLGALKAFMKNRESGLNVRACHPYLSFAHKLGFSRYHAVSQSSWASEAVGASLLHSENSSSCREIFCRTLAGRGQGVGSIPSLPVFFDETASLLQNHLLEFVKELPLEAVSLVGLTACLNQFSAALLTARGIREAAPDIPIVMGGTSCSGSIASSILRSYAFIDYVISGEGELPLHALWRHLTGDSGEEELPAAIFRRDRHETHRAGPGPEVSDTRCQVHDLDALPEPDFDDYFHELSLLPPGAGFYPVLPVEASRGCWWGRCSFCNLNLQWRGYRAKQPARISEEIDYLSRRYRCIDFAFMDNALPRRGAVDIFRELRSHGRDYGFFAELRAVHSRDDYRIMSRGGLSSLQVGVEALSDSLLNRLCKGSRVIENIAAMRHAFEAGVELDGNLIMHFPGSSRAEVEETLQILDFVWPFRPLKTVSFWLGHGSPAEEGRKALGIVRISSHPWWKRMFRTRDGIMPSSLILSYAGDRKEQYRLWKPVEDKVALWKEQRSRPGAPEIPLGYRDAGEFISIRRISPDGTCCFHRLSGLSREIYVFCFEIRSVQAVAEMAGDRISLEQLGGFVQDLVSRRIMFSDGRRILSLAVREG